MCSIFGYECNTMMVSNRLNTLSVAHDLTVNAGETKINGTTTVINTNNVEIKDNSIVLNKGAFGSLDLPSGFVLENKTNYSSIYNNGDLYLLKTVGNPNFATLDPITEPKMNLYANNLVYIDGLQTINAKSLTNVNLPLLTASKILVTDSSKNLSSASYEIADLVLTSGNQSIDGKKSFTDLHLPNLSASRLLLTDSSKNVTTSSLAESDIVNLSGTQTISGAKTFSSNVSVANNTIESKNLITTNATYIGQSLTQNFVYINTKSFAAVISPAVGCNWLVTVLKSNNFNYCSALLQLRVVGSAQGSGNIYGLYNYQLQVENGNPSVALIGTATVSSNPPIIGIDLTGNNTGSTVTFNIKITPDAIGALTACSYVEILCAPGFTASNSWSIT